MAQILSFPAQRAVDVAYERHTAHILKVRAEPHLLDDPEWEAERARLHAEFYALFTGEAGNVTFARFR